MSQKLDKEKTDAAFAAHEREQILFTARNTTPDDRIRWLESSVEFVRMVVTSRLKEGLPVVLDSSKGPIRELPQ